MRQRLTCSVTFPGEAIRFPILIAALHREGGGPSVTEQEPLVRHDPATKS